MEALEGLDIATPGILPEIGEPFIDHLALTPSLKTPPLRVLPARGEDGKPLSDHVGYSLDISGHDV